MTQTPTAPTESPPPATATPAAQVSAPAAGAPAPDYDSRIRQAGFDSFDTALAAATESRELTRSGAVNTHVAMRELAQAWGWPDVASLVEFLKASAGSDGQSAAGQGTPPQGEPSTDLQTQQGVTREMFAEMLQEHRTGILDDVKKLRKGDVDAWNVQQTEAAEQRAEAATAERITEALKVLGFEEPAENASAEVQLHYSTLAGGLMQALEQVREGQIPVTATKAERESFLNAEASAQDVAKATEIFKAAFKDHDNLVLSNAAQAQAQVPRETVGAGAAGSNPPPKDMTELSDEEGAAMAESILKKHGRM